MPNFTEDQLHLIMAMVRSAMPGRDPEDMCEPWAGVFKVAQAQLEDLGTKDSTKNGSTRSSSGARLTREPSGAHTLSGLTDAHIERLQDALDRVAIADRAGMELQKIIYGV